MAFVITYMHRKPWLILFYFVLSIVVPLALLYPAFVYGDLAGTGGYDGFASPAMMLKDGVWATTNGRSLVYTVFGIANCVWLLSLINIPVAVGIALKLFHVNK